MRFEGGEKTMEYCRFILLTWLAGFLLCPQMANAEELVSGHYLTGVGKNLTIELVIGSPPPPLVIVTQKIPKGTVVLNARPELMKFDENEGVAKWLLNKVNPGKMTLTMVLDQPVTRGEISGKFAGLLPT